MFKRASVDKNNVHWITVTCSVCHKEETFGTTASWTDEEITGLISRFGWSQNPEVCTRCKRKQEQIP